MIKAIVFDFDGLIIDTETALYQAYRELLEEHNVTLSIAEYASYVGTDPGALYEFLTNQLTGKMTREEIIEKSYKLHREKLKEPIAREGVQEYLEEAKKQGLKIGLASSSDREWIIHFLKELQIINYFEVIKTRNDVEKVKPDPALYKKVIKDLGILPSEAIAFEDSANGNKAAVVAGLNCVIVPNMVTKTLTFDKYHLRMSSMKEKSLGEIIEFITSCAKKI
ncbi:HAD family hydrolase [Heyndrickxia sp. FSL W8-0423]|uniref:HAD family hydrolase n=1 Tax=Heyndrickxia sp. FSL W8-0423 TaxID=2921601 RepID=UPI0030F9C3D5